MARKRKYRYITDPTLKAAVVVETFVGKAKREVRTWGSRYITGVTDYTRDENRQVFAALKLAGMYMGLNDPEVKNAIRDAIAKAKAKQAEVVSAALPKVPVPIVSPEARSTARKVAEIIGAVAPASPPAGGPAV